VLRILVRVLAALTRYDARLGRNLCLRFPVSVDLGLFIDPTIVAEILVLKDQLLARLQVLKPRVRGFSMLF